MSARSSRYSRVANLIYQPRLQTARTEWIGAGRAVAGTLEHLVRLGLATRPPGLISIHDHDVVEPANLVGTPYWESQAAARMPKVEALREVCEAAEKDVLIATSTARIEERDVPRLADRAQSLDLLALGADEPALMADIADACMDLCPMLMMAFGERADTCEVGFSVPHQTPPLSRILRLRDRAPITGASALGMDVAFCTAFASAVALRLLLGDSKGADLMPLYADCPLFVLGLRPAGTLFSQMPRGQVRTIVQVATRAGRT